MNYEATFAIALALKQHVISRLTVTWKVHCCAAFGQSGPDFFFLQKVGASKKWKKIEALVDSARNYKSYRDTVTKLLNTPIPKEKQVRDPIIPYFGLYLKDITFIDDGNPNSLDNGFMNYDKMKLVASVITQIQQLQTQCGTFKFPSLPILQDYLLFKAEVVPDEDALYEMSLQREPMKSGSNPTL